MEKQKLLEEADTEEKVRRLKKWFGCICTKYVLKSLIRSLNTCLKNTPVLSCLELDGLLLAGEYLQAILKGMVSNKTLKFISFKSCQIGDEGCFDICETLHTLPNIEVLNLTNCNLGPKSGESIAKLIKYQQINRYCESWHSSLRYEDPEVNNMAGMKRITLNNNPKIGDEGLEPILNELVDDLWIKAIDMQKCNITEAISGKILDAIDYNRSLEVADFRHNSLEHDTISRILESLKSKQSEENEYQWCLTSTTLTSMCDVYGSCTNTRPVTTKTSKNINNKVTLKRQMTMPFLPRKAESKETKENLNKSVECPDNQSLVKAKEQLVKLYEKLKEETLRRQQAEDQCMELQKQVDELLSLQKNQMILKEFTNMKTYINKFISFIQQNGNQEEHTPMIEDLQNALEEVQILAKPYERVNKNLENNPKIFVEEKPAKKTSKKDLTQMHTLFENLTGKPIEEDSDVEEMVDFGMNLDLGSSLNQSSSSYIDITDSTRSTDSESVETMKRLLEELSQDDKFSSLDEWSELSRTSSEVSPQKVKKVTLKIPLVTK